MSLKETAACLGYQQITSLSSAVSLTVPATATYALIVAESQIVRWRDDGTVPTASIGMPLAAGAALKYEGNLRGIQLIEQAASATINISYYC